MPQRGKASTRRQTPAATATRCGLCGKTRQLIQTDCCKTWICDDEDTYVPFSYATNSCSRDHRRYTLCGFHHTEEHPGRWLECTRCRGEIVETEMYVWYGTNKYNVEKLQNPPAYEPTYCSRCQQRIVLGEGGYSTRGEQEYFCEACTALSY